MAVTSRRATLLTLVITMVLLMMAIRRYKQSVELANQALAATRVPVYQDAADVFWGVNEKAIDFPSNAANSFREALEKTASEDKTVILAMVDTGYVDMALNFYMTSIEPFGISNMLFVSVTPDTCREMHQLHLPCLTFSNQTAAGKGDYMSKAFLGKMNIRTNFIYQALQWGYSILQVDIDLIFLQNPTQAFTCSECAVESLQDGIKNYINCGFVMLKARPQTINVYKHMVEKAIKEPMSEDQRNLNLFVNKLKVKYRVLDTKKFVCGLDYYEKPKRYFADTAKACKECVVVHNNWIVSKPAKRYRFKEMGQWMVDANGYYGDKTARYIKYGNTKNGASNEEDKSALKTAFAMATVLNRTLIVPKFHCDTKEKSPSCPLNMFLYIRYLDENFPYREHLFLSHPKVPLVIKDGVSSPFKILPPEKKPSNTQQKDEFHYEDKAGLSEAEISRWFGDNKQPVLLFDNLYMKFKGFTDSTMQAEFERKITASFKPAKYRQF